MKKYSATIYSPSMELPIMPRKYSRRLNRVRISKTAVEKPTNISIPTEEMLAELNRIGQQYPFCIYYKSRTYDPL